MLMFTVWSKNIYILSIEKLEQNHAGPIYLCPLVRKKWLPLLLRMVPELLPDA